MFFWFAMRLLGNRQGRYNFSGKYRKFNGYSASGLPQKTAIYDDYISKFGVPSPGQKVSFEFYLVNETTGQVSPRVTTTVISLSSFFIIDVLC